MLKRRARLIITVMILAWAAILALSACDLIVESLHVDLKHYRQGDTDPDRSWVTSFKNICEDNLCAPGVGTCDGAEIGDFFDVIIGDVSIENNTNDRRQMFFFSEGFGGDPPDIVGGDYYTCYGPTDSRITPFADSDGTVKAIRYYDRGVCSFKGGMVSYSTIANEMNKEIKKELKLANITYKKDVWPRLGAACQYPYLDENDDVIQFHFRHDMWLPLTGAGISNVQGYFQLGSDRRCVVADVADLWRTVAGETGRSQGDFVDESYCINQDPDVRYLDDQLIITDRYDAWATISCICHFDPICWIACAVVTKKMNKINDDPWGGFYKKHQKGLRGALWLDNSGAAAGGAGWDNCTSKDKCKRSSDTGLEYDFFGFDSRCTANYEDGELKPGRCQIRPRWVRWVNQYPDHFELVSSTSEHVSDSPVWMADPDPYVRYWGALNNFELSGDIDLEPLCGNNEDSGYADCEYYDGSAWPSH